MHKKFLQGLILTAALGFSSVTYAENFWKPFPGTVAPTSLEKQVNPLKYQIFSLDDASFLNHTAHLSTDPNKGVLLDIPMPDGTTKTFKIWSTPFISQAMMDKYPNYKMITGYDVAQPSNSIKLVYTLYGLSGQIWQSGGPSVVIQPYANENTGYYLSYYKHHEEADIVNCFVNSEASLGSDYDQVGGGPEVSKDFTWGSLQYKYRLSLSATTEWSRTITGLTTPPVATIFAKVMEVVNRLNGYHEREIAVTYDLVSDEVMLFNSHSLDPFTCNANLSCLIDENQTHTDLRVGRANYDIGHVLSTAGGGLAQLASTCRNNGKARGGSTVYSTTALKTLLHEIGHQFSASHTFSANTGGCAGNGMEEGAYEPGSGSTIMSYQSLCNPNDIPMIAGYDDYYHVFSLMQMTTFIPTLTCGTSSENIPVLAIPNNNNTYTIPANTPFELEGSAATITGTQLPVTFSYNWEQLDRKFDMTEANGATATEGPILRSHQPNNKTTQSYPPAQNIIANNYSSPGYRLPTTNRDINFKYTARGVLNGRGAFNTIDSLVTVKVSTAGSNFRVTSFNNAGGTFNWNPGDTVEITWNVGNTNMAPINCGGVSIYLYAPDDTIRTEHQLVSYAPNTGSFRYVVQDFNIQRSYLKIKGAGNIFYDLGKAIINVNGNNTSVTGIDLANQFSLYPNPANNLLNITYPNNNKTFKIAIYNTIGQLIYETEMKDQITVDVSKYATGNYIVKFQDQISGLNAVKKFTISK